MDVHGYQWKFMDIHVYIYIWKSMHFYGYPWISMNTMHFHGYPWISNFPIFRVPKFPFLIFNFPCFQVSFLIYFLLISQVFAPLSPLPRGTNKTRPCRKFMKILCVFAWFSFLVGKHQLKRTQTGPDRPKPAQSDPNQPKPSQTSPNLFNRSQTSPPQQKCVCVCLSWSGV